MGAEEKAQATMDKIAAAHKKKGKKKSGKRG
jgi:hypothetical protein